MPKEYIRRINLAIEYINKNLDQKLNLSILAKVALYSPFHFHRLFTAITGENPNRYVHRLRIERSAYQIKKDKSLSISEIALNNGFESNSSFSKAFKKYYGLSPTFLKNNTNQFSKIRQINSKNGQERIEISNDICSGNHLQHIKAINPIAIKMIPTIRIAYVNYVGEFDKIGNTYETIIKWAIRNNVDTTKRITRFHDSPEVTALSQIRQSACVEIIEGYEINKDVSFSIIEAGKYAVGKFELELKELDNAWQTMLVWVAEQGLIPDERKTCFEIYHNHYSTVGFKKCLIEIFVPIKNKA